MYPSSNCKVANSSHIEGQIIPESPLKINYMPFGGYCEKDISNETPVENPVEIKEIPKKGSSKAQQNCGAESRD
ncbi:26835_t:CDS:1, partial [Racocetra persica]